MFAQEHVSDNTMRWKQMIYQYKICMVFNFVYKKCFQNQQVTDSVIHVFHKM